MSTIKFFKVSQLPSSLLPDAFYYVLNGDFAEAYLTDNLGEVKKIGNSEMIETISSQSPGTFDPNQVIDGGVIF